MENKLNQHKKQINKKKKESPLAFGYILTGFLIYHELDTNFDKYSLSKCLSPIFHLISPLSSAYSRPLTLKRIVCTHGWQKILGGKK